MSPYHNFQKEHPVKRTGSEPSTQPPRMATVTVTKGYSRQMVPVSELPKFGKSEWAEIFQLLYIFLEVFKRPGTFYQIEE